MDKNTVIGFFVSFFLIAACVTGCVVNINSSQTTPTPTSNVPVGSVLINTPVWVPPGGGEATLTFANKSVLLLHR